MDSDAVQPATSDMMRSVDSWERRLLVESLLVLRPAETLAVRADREDAARMLLHGLHTLPNDPIPRHG